MTAARAVALCGSPRPGGNTEAYLETALAVLRGHGIATELVLLRNKMIHSCRGCYACWQGDERVCRVEDDDFREVFDKMVSADALIVGSPVHYSAVHPDLWSVLVRAGFPSMANHPHSAPRPFSRKIGGAITVARRAGHNFALAQLLLWFSINGFVVPGSIYWTVGVARSPGDAEKDAEGIETVTRFAESVAWLVERTQA
jgi:multimeric flavodoxin WrbA